MSLKLSGIPIRLESSKQAPVSERLRTMQSIGGAFAKEIEPPLNVRCRRLVRCSSVKYTPWKRGPSSRADIMRHQSSVDGSARGENVALLFAETATGSRTSI